MRDRQFTKSQGNDACDVGREGNGIGIRIGVGGNDRLAQSAIHSACNAVVVIVGGGDD